ncbi:N-acetyltransferase [Flexivirga caeni]|uniref:N-acetyltransferase n=1 Tax=Flexivirga caeni TaxID=2294115 RepID=A0A3M9MB39_9MICO|nr:N-acetyltransferase [Flexivirga caeni]RNI22790.1 N-acetyltransferase [Flexivirga caeni]
MSSDHPLAQILRAAAAGDPPPADGGWRRLSPWNASVFGIVTFTGHAVLCVPDDVTDIELAGLHPDGFGGAADPRVVTVLAGTDGWIDSLDVLLAARGLGGRPELLVPRPDLTTWPRARRAVGLRSAVETYGVADRDDVLVTIGNGIAGLLELSFEVDLPARGAGLGRRLIADARRLVATDEILLAAVAPGNVASLRATLAAGFTPVAGVQLFHPADHHG